MEEEHHPIFSGRPKYSRFNWVQVTLVSLIVALVVAVAIIIALAASLGVANNRNNPKPAPVTATSHIPTSTPTPTPTPTSSSTPTPTPTPTPGLCLTESCVNLASTILNSLDTSVNPCDDFYNFTCGNWVKNRVLPPGTGRLDTFEQLVEQNQIGLKRVLESDADDGVEAVVKVKKLYQSCMDTTAINAAGAEPLLGVIETTGGWNLVGMSGATWGLNSSDFIAEKMFSSPAFFTIDVEPDDKNTTRNVLVLTQSGLSLPSAASYMDNQTAVGNLDALRTLMLTVLGLINPNMTSQYAAAVEDMINLEQDLADIWVSNVALRDPVKAYNVYSIGNLSTLWPEYDWMNNLNSIFNLSGTPLSDSERVIVHTPTYFANLSTVLFNVSDDLLENYAKWQLVRTLLPYLSDNFTAAYYTFREVVAGQGEKPRYQTCINIAQTVLPIAVARPYTDFILANGTKEKVSGMIDEVKTAFKERLDMQNWITNTTREACKDKVDKITKMVAYPDMIDNNTYLNDLYKDYNITETSYFGNYLEYVRAALTENQAQVHKPVDKQMWLIPPTAVNAYYSPQFNQFVFLEGILNMPFFQAGWPDYFKYGALGVVIGHELTHGFDDQGQQYNAEGILTQWWDTESTDHFKERQGCFVEQYDQYELFGFHINGNLTLGENLADNGGLKAAFQAFKNVAQQANSPQLPALSGYTPEQLYYIAFGQLWCSMFSPQYIASSTKVDPHSPGPYRVVGAVVNDPDFATAFQCANGTAMNPEKKCYMW